MARKVFINYRRSEDWGAAQALYQQLAGAFPTDDLFMDVEGHIKPGDDFVKVLTAQVAACDVLLALIGPRWAELLAARAGDLDDFVVVEIRAALDHGKRVIPVLVGNAAMPRAEALPQPMRSLARLHAVSLRPERFAADCHGLVTALKEHFAAERKAHAALIEAERATGEAERKQRAAEAAAPGRGTLWRWAAAGALGLAAVVFAALYFTGGGGQPAPGAKTTEPPKVAVKPPDAVSKPPAATPQPPPPPVQKRDPVFSPRLGIGPLTTAEELAIKPGHSFKECDVCPEMVVVPAGTFTMGSPTNEEGRGGTEYEGLLHKVVIARSFAVGKYESTFAEWDACVAAGGCRYVPSDQSWGRGMRPVINVSWYDITAEYLPWLSRKTGKTYRLLTEAEWEYAARAGTTTPFWWGSSISISRPTTMASPRIKAVQGVTIGLGRHRWMPLPPIHGACTTCMAMSRNGCRIAGEAIFPLSPAMQVLQQTARLGRRVIAIGVFSAEAPTPRGGRPCVRRPASDFLAMSAAATTASALPEALRTEFGR